MEQFSPNIVLDNICMAAVFIVALYNFIRMWKGKKGTGYIFFVIFILLFSLYYRPEGGDFWGYLSRYQMNSDSHMEAFYYWLMDVIPNNFLLWRTAIWLPAGIIIAVTYKKMHVASNNATVFFLVFALIQTYYYLRNILGFSVLALAVVIYCSRVHIWGKIKNIALFVGLLFIAWYLHKSMPLYILFAVLAIVLPLNKNYISGALIVVPLLYGFTTFIAADFIQNVDIWHAGNGADYLEMENTFAMNWKGVVDYMIRYSPILYFYYIAFFKPLPTKSQDYSYYKVFLLLAFFIFCLSVSFMGQATDVLYLRFYYSSMFPFALTVSVYFKHYMYSRQCTIFLYLTVLAIAWQAFLFVVS